MKTNIQGNEVTTLSTQPSATGNDVCRCREIVNAKIDNGELRQALSRSSSIPPDGQRSLVDQATRRSYLKGRYVGGGYVREVLDRAHWSENEIDFLLYRSQHNHIVEA